MSCANRSDGILTMGIFKRAMLENYGYGYGYGHFLQELLAEGGIEGAAAGITKQVIASGGDTEQLSEKQRRVFKKWVEDISDA